jgi:hypothetical protein
VPGKQASCATWDRRWRFHSLGLGMLNAPASRYCLRAPTPLHYESALLATNLARRPRRVWSLARFCAIRKGDWVFSVRNIPDIYIYMSRNAMTNAATIPRCRHDTKRAARSTWCRHYRQSDELCWLLVDTPAHICGISVRPSRGRSGAKEAVVTINVCGWRL